MSLRNSLLWKLSLPASEGVSYLFGTMHIRDKRAFAGLGKVYSCIDACPVFALELDLGEEPGWGGYDFLRFPGQSSLHDFLNPRAYSRLRKSLLKAFRIDIALFSGYSPFAIVDIITAQVMSEDHPLFLDAHLWQYAEMQGKKNMGIETLEEQTGLLLRMPLEVQVKMLREIGRDTAGFRATLHRMAAVYQEGDLKNLYRLSRKSSGALRKEMLFDRNEVMARRIADLLSKENLFCAIGAGHLWGGKGVLRLLKRRGIRVVPVHLP